MGFFGEAFLTRKEAKIYAKKVNGKGPTSVKIRRISKKLHPHHKKLFHVGTYLDFLNWRYYGNKLTTLF